MAHSAVLTPCCGAEWEGKSQGGEEEEEEEEEDEEGEGEEREEEREEGGRNPLEDLGGRLGWCRLLVSMLWVVNDGVTSLSNSLGERGQDS